MRVIIPGRVASCKEKTSKKGKGYYLVRIVQGEGSEYVNTISVFSSYEVELGEQREVECNLRLRDGMLSIFTVND